MGAQFDYDQTGNTTLIFVATVLSLYVTGATINRIRLFFSEKGLIICFFLKLKFHRGGSCGQLSVRILPEEEGLCSLPSREEKLHSKAA